MRQTVDVSTHTQKRCVDVVKAIPKERLQQHTREHTVDMLVVGQRRVPMVLPAPRGAPQMDVAFNINANEIMNVSVQDKSTGRPNQTTITNGKGLWWQTEIDRMFQEAERCQDEDETNKSKIEVKNG